MRFIPLKLSHVSDQDHQDIVDQYDDQWRQIAFEELSKNAIFNPFKLKQMLLVLVLQLRENDCGRWHKQDDQNAKEIHHVATEYVNALIATHIFP